MLGFIGRPTHFNVKLHFGDEQFEVDAAQLPIAFTQMTLRIRDDKEKNKFFLLFFLLYISYINNVDVTPVVTGLPRRKQFSILNYLPGSV